MNRSLRCGTLFSLLFLLLLPMSSVASRADQARQAVAWSQVRSHASGLTARLSIDRFAVSSDDLGAYLTIPGTLPNESPIPDVHTFIAAPAGMTVSASLSGSRFEDAGISAPGYAGSEPGVEAGEAVVFRGIRLVPLRIRPARVDNGGQVQLASDLTLNVEFVEQEGGAVTDDGPVRVTAEVERFIRQLVLNLDDVDISVVAPVGRLLIVMENDATILSRVQPYIDWKRQQGYTVEVDFPTNPGSTSQILQIVQTHYTADDELPLDYVLLIGDDDGPVGLAAYNNITDHYYSQLEGNDILGDVAIGRFSVQESNLELLRVVGKTLTYERDFDQSDPSWMTNSVLTAGSGSGISTILTNQSIKGMLAEHGITADTLWHTMPSYPGGIPQFIVDKVNAGAQYVNYRGYYGMSGWNSSYLDDFTNLGRLPLIITITCGTGDFATQGQSISEGFFRAGTGTSGRGGVASVGTATTATHTRFNNVVDAGIYEAIMLQDVRSLGWALLNGKLRLYQAYNNTGDEGQIQNFTYWNNLMGDPALRMFVGQPDPIEVSHPAELSWGENFVDVSVTHPGDWPDLIWATLSDNEDVLASQRIMPGGSVRLTFDPALTSGEMMLTVVGDDVIPYQSAISIVDEAQYVYVSASSVNDGPGGDDIANPGETVALNLTMTNGGSDPAPARNGSLTSSSPYVTVLDGSFAIPALAAGASTTINNAVQIEIAGWTPDGAVPDLTVNAGTAGQDSDPSLEIVGWTISAGSLEPQFGDDGVWDAGEQTTVVLPWANVGSRSANDLTGTLSVEHGTGIEIIDGTSDYGFAMVGGTGTNATDPFVVNAGEGSRQGQPVTFVLAIEDAAGGIDSTRYITWLGDPAGQGLSGPDAHGYWAMDNTDTGFGVPVVYNWMDIRSPENQLPIEDLNDEDDDAAVVDLPFIFGYYNQPYSEMTVTSNGMAFFGTNTTLYTFRNWPIPNPNGPAAMLAPNWDDMVTDNGGVYSYHDEATGRFILQWDVLTRNTDAGQSFQIVLFDPAVWPTTTGNGLIKFQYESFSEESGYYHDNDYCTVGIESPDQQNGLQVLYWTTYDGNAAQIVEGRTILFTDDLSGGTAQPAMSITPASLEQPWQEGDPPVIQTLTLANDGAGALIWSLNAINNEFIGAERRAALGLPANPVLPDYRSSAEPVNLERYHARKRQEAARLSGEVDDGGGSRVIDNEGGPDEFGYTWVDSDEPDGPVFEWHSDYGSAFTDAQILDGDYDDGYFNGRQLPFSFEYYGVPYDMVYVNTNGFLTFNNGQIGLDTYQNIPLPSLAAPNADSGPATVIAPFWDDLNPEEGGTIWFYSNNDDLAVITFEGIYGWGPRGGPYTFQVQLHADGRILYQYLDMGTERLDECTVGIQNESGNIGLTIVDDAPYVTDNLAIRLATPTIWFEVLDPSGLLLEGESFDARVQFDGDGMPDGVFEGLIAVSSNDGGNPTVNVPVTMYVGAQNLPPVVSDIPDQLVETGGAFDPIPLDEYVTDPNFPDDQIQWTATGQQELTVEIVDRVATITAPTADWTGSELITFTATNPNNGSDSDAATFAVGADPVVISLQPNRFELISLPRVPVSLQVEDVFASVTSLIAVQDDGGGVYLPNQGINTIGQIDIAEGYRVYTGAAEEFVVSGLPLDEDTEYSLTGNVWNWSGHPFDQEVNAVQALSPIGDLLNIVVNDDGEFWWPDLGINTLGTLVPGDGYQIHVREDVTFAYSPPVSAVGLASLPNSADMITELPAVPFAPEPTGKPFPVHVRLTRQLAELGAATVELLDGETVVGAGPVIEGRSEAVVIAWGVDPARPQLAGFQPGHDVRLRVRDTSGSELPAERTGRDGLQFSDTGFASVTLRSAALPEEFEVSAGYPNPFNPTVTVPVALPEAGRVQFAVFNVLGQQVFAETRQLKAGRHSFVFSPDHGATSGVYFLRVRYAGHLHQQKVVLLK